MVLNSNEIHRTKNVKIRQKRSNNIRFNSDILMKGEMKIKDCIFCNIANGEIPSATLYEDEELRVIGSRQTRVMH